MKFSFCISALLSVNSVYSASIPAPSWLPEWNLSNPPSLLEEIRKGEAIGYGENQKWISLTSPTSGRYIAAENNYTGDIYLMMDLGAATSQSAAIYAASPVFHGNTNVYVKSGKFPTIYAGARAGEGETAIVDGNTNVTIGGTTKITASGSSAAVYGGGFADKNSTSIVKGGSNIHITETAGFDAGYNSFVLGGGYTTTTDEKSNGGHSLVEGGSHILIDGGVANSTLNVRGGGWAYENGRAEIIGGTHIELAAGGYAYTIAGGGHTSGTDNKGVSVVDNAQINITGGEVDFVIGGGVSNWFGKTQVTDGVVVNVSGGTIKSSLVGGGQVDGGNTTALLKGHSEVQGGVSINISGSANVADVYGGGSLYDKGVASTVEGGSVIEMTGGTVQNIHGGGFLSAWDGTSLTQDYDLLVSVDQTTINVKGGTVTGNVFGGGKSEIYKDGYSQNSTALNQVGSVNIHISNGTIGTALDGGGWNDGQVYGGGEGPNTHITGDTNVTISGGQMGGVCGGGLGDNTIGGNAHVTISGGTINGSVYAGSFDTTSVIKGNAHLTLEGSNWTVLGTLNGGYADGSKILELSKMTDRFSEKVSAERVSGFNQLNLTNGSIQDIGGLAGYGLKVDVSSGSILTRKDPASSTASASLSQGGYFDANGADLASVTLGSGSYSWLSSNGGAIINFSHTDAPIDVDTDLAVAEGDSVKVSSIGQGGSIASAGGKVDVSQVASQEEIILGSYNDSTGKPSSANVLMDAQKSADIVANNLVVEKNKTTVVNNTSAITAAQLTVSDKTSVLENNGNLSQVDKLIVTEGTLKGSGLFGTVIMEGGRLIVGNSPGTQTFSSLELGSSSNTVFSINGLTPNDGTTSGWQSNTYSNLNVGSQLTLVAGTTFTLEFSRDFLKTLEAGKEYSFDLVFFETLSGNIADVNLAYSSYNSTNDSSNVISSPFEDARLEATATGIRFVGVAGNAAVPEPSSALLGLTGLLVLSWRRRRVIG